jgi:hypothetical protein
MSRRLVAAAILGLLLASMAAGCVPYLDKTPRSYGVKGRAVDAVSGKPLSKVQLSLITSGETFTTRTSADGRFDVSPTYAWYWTWAMCGPVELCPGLNTDVQVTAQGYMPFKITVEHLDGVAQSRPTEPAHRRLEEDHLILEDVRLQPAQRDHDSP